MAEVMHFQKLGYSQLKSGQFKVIVKFVYDRGVLLFCPLAKFFVITCLPLISTGIIDDYSTILTE